ncbi:MAG TPA: 50S ribosomal protein L2 [Thermoplasmata archaeon]|nr:50S ribosomal protein L2 [Thermoplasmata archaeon]
MGKKMIQQRRGRGTFQYRNKSSKIKVKYIPPSPESKGQVLDLIHEPGHTAPVAELRLHNGKKIPFLAPEGIAVGDEILFSQKPHVELGSVLPLKHIPDGTPIFNLELKPGDGGKLVRAAGAYATVTSHDAKGATLSLPSGKFKQLNPDCRATIGISAGGGRGDQPFLSAGKRYKAFRKMGKVFPRVSGVAMNAVDHPHGGGSHGYEGGPTSLSRGASPGQKAGKVAPKRTGKR